MIHESPATGIGRSPHFPKWQDRAVRGATWAIMQLTRGPIVGRDELLGSVADSVGAHRLVTLTGVGGVGKTRLAVEVASRLEHRFDEGAWFVDLATVGEAEAVPDVVASTLGVAPNASTSTSQSLVETLSGRHLLLVVDNCEHVLGAVAELAQGLLARPGGLRILATSRERLRTAGEHEVAVPPLAVADPSSPAVMLFEQRARVARPNFSIDDHPTTATAVVEICSVLDGLPLGIELAAARMAGMSVGQVRDRLGDRFRLLDGEPDAPMRHQSLGELVRWSYELLDVVEREVLARAAVFVGGFDLAAYLGVFGLEDDVAELRSLDRLVRSSLVIAEHDGGLIRYRLLETIRQFGIDELADAGLLDASRQRHARWFAGEVVERWSAWNGPGWAAAVEWVKVELADLRAAFVWARDRDVEVAVDVAAHAALIGVSGHLFEPISWAEGVLEAATVADVRRLPRLLSACGYAGFVGRPELAASRAEQAMALESGPGYDPCEPGLSAFIGALAHVYAGHLDRYVELAAIADGYGGSARAFGRTALVDGLQATGRVDEAIELVDSAVAAAHDVASPFWIAYALWVAGLTLTKVDPARALAAWHEGTAVVDEHGVDFFRGFLARDAARLSTTAGEADVALAQFDVAIESFHRAGNVAQLVITLASVPALFDRLGRPEAALTLHAAMTQLPASLEHVPDLSDVGARVAAQLGPSAPASVLAGRAMDLDAAAAYARSQIGEARQVSPPTAPRPGGLSSREVEVLGLVADGHSTREIASRLFISVKTADRHIQNIYTKIGTSSRAGATRWALDHDVAR
jgi:predicted ATPase/DNA-binding CsgD family transcriptional regulator/tetratricopeptide (TPR) repeat protein